VTTFIGTFENKLDSKGRVSVPAPFRAALVGQNFHGIVAFPSFRLEAIEACGMDFIEKLTDSATDFDLFSDDQDAIATTIFAESQQLAMDGEGRVVLPAGLIEHAGIDKQVAFVGMGRLFQIWEPGALRNHKLKSRERAREKGLTLKLRRSEESS
jgi:MraZ protein